VRGVGIRRTDSSRRRGSSRVGLLMAAVVVVVEMERIMTLREVFGLSCRMNWRGWMRRKMKRRKGGDSESNSGD
jgi:hypothetical protein